ncbi:hypothetical protein RM545_10535 [Zunongwangia sp. F260]|uniref:Uncharacterized protein n=1 Tax=Autumnicola lenta TaxID=3075593 RepID=A0ABU3CL83_9FLAO|nr:hypothetical protein [Zunongwangia sp. F260]MDT0647124.1 hypothetical protein [Zunongwangia sp. F260]
MPSGIIILMVSAGFTVANREIDLVLDLKWLFEIFNQLSTEFLLNLLFKITAI